MDRKEAFVRQKISKQRHNARYVRHIPWDISTDRLVEQIMANPYCQLSGEPLEFEPNYTTTFSLDRKDSTKGYTHDNVQWVGVSVNLAKSNLSDDQFIDMCTSVAKHSGLLLENEGENE
jgi:hypothetical protein